VDFFLPDSKQVIEIQGPGHYIAPTHELNMTTEAKIRVLEKKGYQVIQVPYFINDPRYSQEEQSHRLEDILSAI